MGLETYLLGSTAIGTIGNIIGGNRAASASADGARQASETERYMYDTTRSDMAPYRETGTAALNQLASLYGIQQQPMSYGEFSGQHTGNTIDNATGQVIPDKINQMASNGGRWGGLISQAANNLAGREDMTGQYQEYLASLPQQQSQPDYSSFYNSPDYRFAYDEGLKSVEQSMARRGLSNSGASMKALTRFGQGLASQQLGNYKNQLAALAGIGQTATNATGQLGANAAANIGANQRSAADSRASSYLNAGSAISGAANQYGQYQLLKAGGYFN